MDELTPPYIKPMATMVAMYKHLFEEFEGVRRFSVFAEQGEFIAEIVDGLLTSINLFLEDIREFISATTVTKGVGPRDIVVNLRVDQGATVGKLTAVKQELRKADAISIAYAAKATNH